MIKPFFRWLYHHRQRQAARDRLLGRRKMLPRFRRFSYHAFERATFGKYDPAGLGKVWKTWLLYLPLGALALWFIVESIRALSLFQP